MSGAQHVHTRALSRRQVLQPLRGGGCICPRPRLRLLLCRVHAIDVSTSVGIDVGGCTVCGLVVVWLLRRRRRRRRWSRAGAKPVMLFQLRLRRRCWRIGDDNRFLAYARPRLALTRLRDSQLARGNRCLLPITRTIL